MSPAVLILVALVAWWLFASDGGPPAASGAAEAQAPPPQAGAPPQLTPNAFGGSDDCPAGTVPAHRYEGGGIVRTCTLPPLQEADQTAQPVGFGSAAPPGYGTADSVGYGSAAQLPVIEPPPPTIASMPRTIQFHRGGRGGTT